MDNTLTYQNYSSDSQVTDPVSIIEVDHIVGTAEVAMILGCPKQQIYTLRKRKDFPMPLRTLAATPLWNAIDIKNFADTWVRRKTKSA